LGVVGHDDRAGDGLGRGDDEVEERGIRLGGLAHALAGNDRASDRLEHLVRPLGIGHAGVVAQDADCARALIGGVYGVSDGGNFCDIERDTVERAAVVLDLSGKLVEPFGPGAGTRSQSHPPRPGSRRTVGRDRLSLL
jgi:hypothetical protein